MREAFGRPDEPPARPKCIRRPVMRAPLAAMAALAGGLLFLPAVQSPASATSVPINMKNVLGSTTGSVILVGHGGGGGPAFSGGGGGRFGGGGGGGPKFSGGPRGGSGNFVSRSGGHDYGNRVNSGPRYANRDFNRSGPKGDMRRGNSQAFNRDRDRDHGNRNRRFAERHDNNHDHDRFRHRVFRNGVWVWVYGPDYYAYGGDCWWLRRQALATGSPYWWSRYNACVGYY